MAIVVPGRRIGTAFNSVVAQKRFASRKRSVYAALMLTSMVDMFTILVLYLIQQFNSTGQILFMDPNVALPKAQRAIDVNGTPPVVTIAKDVISVQGRPVEQTSSLIKEGQWDATKLEEALRQLKSLSEEVRNVTGGSVDTEAAKGALLVQADLTIPYILVKKVLFIAAKAGFPRADFAVTQTAVQPPQH